MYLFDSSSAGNGTFINNGGTARRAFGGATLLFGTSTAGEAIFINNAGAVTDAIGGKTLFLGAATADQGTFISNAGAVSDAVGGSTEFRGFTNAANANLVANGVVGGDITSGGSVLFSERSHGGAARVAVFDNGYLDISYHELPGTTIGSIEGNGVVFLGFHNLTVGSNHLSTNFSGVMRDGGRNGGFNGSLTKIGTGKLVLSHRNTYSGGTTVKRGRLIVNNIGGSGTGGGPVEVNGGRFGGMGTIAGVVTVGSGRGRQAVLSPGYHHSSNPGTLTIQSPLRFNSDGTYEIEVNSSSETVDKVVAFGVTINTGAETLFADLGNGTFTVGDVFTVIDNTSATPIAGTFSDLPDGAVFTLNGNNFQASYTGGDGNDLTLTVVP